MVRLARILARTVSGLAWLALIHPAWGEPPVEWDYIGPDQYGNQATLIHDLFLGPGYDPYIAYYGLPAFYDNYHAWKYGFTPENYRYRLCLIPWFCADFGSRARLG